MSCSIYKAGILSCTLNDVKISDDIYMKLDQVKAGDDTIVFWKLVWWIYHFGEAE